MKWKLGLIGLVVFLVGSSMWWGYRTTIDLVKAILTPGYGDPGRLVQQFKTVWFPATKIAGWLPETDRTLPLKAIVEAVPHLDKLLGMEGERRYVLLLQNNMELRPTGGFMGSYALIRFNQGRLVDIQIEDIYTPDGQIKGYVPEPKPITKYLFNDGTPGWRLRDANWHPDFVESTKAIEWFFNEAGMGKIDGFGAITLNPLIELLRQNGELRLSDYNWLPVSAENFYALAQSYAETDFFPGSTQKRDFLGSVAKQMLLTVIQDPDKMPVVAKVGWGALTQKELSIFVPDVMGEAWKKLGWDGSLRQTDGDYLMINEANVGISKANCCIERRAVDKIVVNEGKVNHSLTLNYKNNNPATPEPPKYWGGGYKNYLRLVVPKNSELVSVMIDGTEIGQDEIDSEDFENHRTFGFLSNVAGGSESTIQVNYKVPMLAKDYRLLFQKQSGVDKWPITWVVRGKEMATELGSDAEFSFRLE